MAELSAGTWALNQVEAVPEKPAKRLELLERTIRSDRTGSSPSAVPTGSDGFMRWELARNVLAPLHSTPAGSPWWRGVNERLLRDGCEAVARSGGRGGSPSFPGDTAMDVLCSRSAPRRALGSLVGIGLVLGDP
jgi:hypothetical protein